MQNNPPVTSSSGFNWRYVQLQTPYNFISEIFFVDSLYGWASHGNGGIHRTTDSGFNWVYDNRDSGGCICGVHFINRNTGWAVGSCGKIWKSTNGGVNWIIQDYQGCAGWYNSVHFFNEDTGIVIGFKSPPGGAYVIKTTDGGYNWREMYNQNTPKGTHALLNKRSLIAMRDTSMQNTPIGNNAERQNTVLSLPNLPREYKLYQNYPNPFNPATTIKYDIPRDGNVSLKIYDILGREVYSMNEFRKAGSYEFRFIGENLASGLYYYRIGTEGFVETKKMILIK